MELQELYSLIDRFSASGLTGLEWEHKGERVALRREGTVVLADTPAGGRVLRRPRAGRAPLRHAGGPEK